jgi:hypothetical protein
MLNDGNNTLVERDVKGNYHFNGNFKNAADLEAAIDQLQNTPYAALVIQDKKLYYILLRMFSITKHLPEGLAHFMDTKG